MANEEESPNVSDGAREALAQDGDDSDSTAGRSSQSGATDAETENAKGADAPKALLEDTDEDYGEPLPTQPLLGPPGDPEPTKVSISSCIFFFVACALVAMNLAYLQPLLDLLGKLFDVGVSEAGFIATASSVGYMFGLINVSPLGDVLEKKWVRSVVVVAVLLLVGINIALGLVRNYAAFVGVTFGMGVLAGTLNIMFSMGVEIAPPAHRGAVLGSMVSGNMFGALAARLVAGAVTDRFGYQWVFFLAATEMFLLSIALHFFLPTPKPAPPQAKRETEGEPTSGFRRFAASYWEVFSSMGTLLVQHPLLLKVCTMAFLTFTAFSTFWVTSTFLLAGPPYFLTPQGIGMLGLAGIAGILVTPVLGYLADRVRYYFLNAIGTTFSVLIWTSLFLFGSRSLAVVFLGAFFLDVATFSVTLVNRTVALKHLPHALARVNAIYSVSFCIGNSLGSALGPWLWASYGWLGTAAVGIGCAVAVQILGLWRVAEERAPLQPKADVETGSESRYGATDVAVRRPSGAGEVPEVAQVANGKNPGRVDSDTSVESDSGVCDIGNAA
ncbi:major facilitator superfamily domain-containing protein [Hyaloraphidium curvatum]|nr:major facilitator superfamily domain-containing protein [Hyaloraphidium curvatum]